MSGGIRGLYPWQEEARRLMDEQASRVMGHWHSSTPNLSGEEDLDITLWDEGPFFRNLVREIDARARRGRPTTRILMTARQLERVSSSGEIRHVGPGRILFLGREVVIMPEPDELRGAMSWGSVVIDESVLIDTESIARTVSSFDDSTITRLRSVYDDSMWESINRAMGKAQTVTKKEAEEPFDPNLSAWS